MLKFFKFSWSFARHRIEWAVWHKSHSDDYLIQMGNTLAMGNCPFFILCILSMHSKPSFLIL